MSITAMVEPDGDRFHAYTLGFDGIHVNGETVEEAFENLTECVSAHLDSLIKHQEPIPVGVHVKIEAPEASSPSLPTIQQLQFSWPLTKSVGIS